MAGLPHDLDEPAPCAVLASGHRVANAREELEVLLLAGQKRVSPEVRKDPIDDRFERSRLPLQRPVTAIRSDRAAAEVGLQQSQDLCPIAVLAHGQARPDLPTDAERRPA